MEARSSRVLEKPAGLSASSASSQSESSAKKMDDGASRLIGTAVSGAVFPVRTDLVPSQTLGMTGGHAALLGLPFLATDRPWQMKANAYNQPPPMQNSYFSDDDEDGEMSDDSPIGATSRVPNRTPW